MPKTASSTDKVNILLQEAVFFDKFSDLISAEVPLLRALEIAATSVRDKTLQTLLLQIKPRLEQGESITDAFRKHSNYFSSFHLAIIETGEKDGHLEDGFKRLAELMRSEAETLELEESSSLHPITLSAKNMLDTKPIMGTVEQLSAVSAELSTISSHLASVSRQLSRLTKQSKSPNHKKAKRKR